MGGHRRGGAKGWLRHPGGPGGLALLLTGAGLTVIAAAALIVEVHLPAAPSRPAADERAADALEAIAETLGIVAGAPEGTRNVSITIRLDGEQWEDVRGAAAGLREFGTGFARRAEGIAADAGRAADKADEIDLGVRKLSETTGGVADSVGEVADKVDGIARGVRDISEEAERIGAHIWDMARPWGCDSPSCLGAVRFPHNEPSEAWGNVKCGEPGWDGWGIPGPTKSDLDGIVEKLKGRDPSDSSPIWILGHASTLGSERRNEGLSWRRARFVECYLKEKLPISFETCATGEEESKNSLRYPDFRYRIVHVFSGPPPEFFSGLKGPGETGRCLEAGQAAAPA